MWSGHAISEGVLLIFLVIFPYFGKSIILAEFNQFLQLLGDVLPGHFSIVLIGLIFINFSCICSVFFLISSRCCFLPCIVNVVAWILPSASMTRFSYKNMKEKLLMLNKQ